MTLSLSLDSRLSRDVFFYSFFLFPPDNRTNMTKKTIVDRLFFKPETIGLLRELNYDLGCFACTWGYFSSLDESVANRFGFSTGCFLTVLGELLVRMRSFQVMRYGRRVTPTPHEIIQSIIQSENLSTISRRPSSPALIERERRSSLYTDEENDHIEPQR